MTDIKWNDDSSALARETGGVETFVHGASTGMQVGSGGLAGASVYIYLETMQDNQFFAIVFAVLVACMTAAALFSFTAATIKLFPRLTGKQQVLGALTVVIGLVAFSLISGTSNATFLAYGEAKQLANQSYLAGAEYGFQDAQNDAAEFAQIIPILTAGRDVASAMRMHEEQDGETGGGRGPIYSELLAQETRLQAVENDLRTFVAGSQTLIRNGQAVLEHMRSAMKDPKFDDDQRQRALENGLTRLATITIQLRQQMPLASLRGVADMLSSPISLPSYSVDPLKRQIQDETVARLQGEFEPIGTALRNAVTGMEENGADPVPVYQRQSPTGMVFAHAGELWFVIGLGYSLDLLPFLALGLIMLARGQLRINAASRPANPSARPVGRPPGKRRPNGVDTDDDSDLANPVH